MWNRKCGCTSIKHWFHYIHYGNTYEGDIHVWEQKHRQFRAHKRDFNNSPYYKFIICRNPYARLVSFFTNHYRYGTAGFELSLTFAQFIKKLTHTSPQKLDGHVQPQTYGLDGLKIHRIIKLEELKYELPKVEQYLQIPNAKYFHANASPRIAWKRHPRPIWRMRSAEFTAGFPPWYNFYNVNLGTQVYQYYEEDFLTFRYNRFPVPLDPPPWSYPAAELIPP